YRINNGRFTNINELQRIEGIGPYRFKKIEPHVSL
ncbi:MAG: ComEA family DNA-binding protein, partial [Candidatus Dadabacteria bacterium]|nr:ComEA family DNA-binding protein [Candidatus Dadabacteria bacterium]